MPLWDEWLRGTADDGSTLDPVKVAGYRAMASGVSVPDRLAACPHRGDLLRTETGRLCGMEQQMIEVHTCAKYGEAADRRFCHKQTVRSCVECLLRGEDRDQASSAPENSGHSAASE